MCLHLLLHLHIVYTISKGSCEKLAVAFLLLNSRKIHFQPYREGLVTDILVLCPLGIFLCSSVVCCFFSKSYFSKNSFSKPMSIFFQILERSGRGSVVDCLTRDRRVADLGLTGVTALCPSASTLILA